MYYMKRQLANQRDKIVFGEYYDKDRYRGGIRYFSHMPVESLHELLKRGFADPDNQQNYAPPIKEIVQFLDKHPNFWAHGYAVSPERDDCRVSVEGVECGSDYTLSDIQDFFSTFYYPDTLRVTANGVYCCYD